MSVDVFGLTFHSQQPPTASLKSANNYIARNAFDYLELNLGLDELVHLKDYHLSLHSTTPLKRVVIDDAYFRDKRRDGVVFPSSRTLAAGLSVSAAATTITTPVVSPAVNTPPRLPPALVPPPPQAAASASVPKINSVASASIKGKAPLVFSSTTKMLEMAERKVASLATSVPAHKVPKRTMMISLSFVVKSMRLPSVFPNKYMWI